MSRMKLLEAQRNDAWTDIRTLRAARDEWREAARAEAELIAALRQELERQWEYNHFEHCGRDAEHADGSRCHWPRPPVLLETHGFDPVEKPLLSQPKSEGEHTFRVVSSYQDGERILEASGIRNVQLAEVMAERIRHFRADQDEGPTVTVERQFEDTPAP